MFGARPTTAAPPAGAPAGLPGAGPAAAVVGPTLLPVATAGAGDDPTKFPERALPVIEAQHALLNQLGAVKAKMEEPAKPRIYLDPTVSGVLKAIAKKFPDADPNQQVRAAPCVRRTAHTARLKRAPALTCACLCAAAQLQHIHHLCARGARHVRRTVSRYGARVGSAGLWVGVAHRRPQPPNLGPCACACACLCVIACVCVCICFYLCLPANILHLADVSLSLWVSLSRAHPFSFLVQPDTPELTEIFLRLLSGYVKVTLMVSRLDERKLAVAAYNRAGGFVPRPTAQHEMMMYQRYGRKSERADSRSGALRVSDACGAVRTSFPPSLSMWLWQHRPVHCRV
jgi:hypothetical protein